MRHHTAAKIGDGYHFASLSRRGGYPLGYCAEHDPHATEAEARECFGRWLRDHVREFGKTSWTNCMLKGCDAPAQRRFEVEGEGYRLAVLCDEHASISNAITVMHLEGAACDSWES